MSDHRHKLQATFEPTKRYAHYGDVIVQMHIKGIRNHSDTLLRVESPVTALCGVNGTGKSTILQLAATAYQAAAGRRFYVSTFILAGTLDNKPFEDNASVEYSYAEDPASSGAITTRQLTITRSGSSWSGYDRQSQRHTLYLGTGFYLPHADRDDYFKSLIQERTFTSRSRSPIDVTTAEWVSRILLCKYDASHVNQMRKKYGRSHTSMISAARDGGVSYSESNMGSGEARLYQLIMRIEAMPPKSLLLLEEPETALHPSAQFELGKYLVNAAERRQLQMFVTTHSEYLLLALPQKSRIYLKREGSKIVPLPGVGVRQAISMMDSLLIPSMHILVEDDVAESLVLELLRLHDLDFMKTVRVVIAGDAGKIQQVITVLEEQNMPICAVRDGDKGANTKKRIYKLFGTEPPEKEIFKSPAFRTHCRDALKVDWGAIDIANEGLDHHQWFDALERQCALKRPELLAIAARVYLEGIMESDRKALVDQIKGSAS